MPDLQELPKLSDTLSYLYVERCIVEKKQQAIELFDENGATLVPAAGLAVLLLGPGTRVTHAAVRVLAASGCTLVWVGEDGTRCYASGGGRTRKGYKLLHQAKMATNPDARLEVCKRMYRMRFAEDLDPDLTIEQLRGMEGARVRTAYARLSMSYGVTWHGRSYDRAAWGNSDPVNRAISAANALLNGLCHAAIIAGGYSPGLGFIHTGLQTSFVYDIADLYKVETTLPAAFSTVGASRERVQPRVRQACRQAFKDAKLLQRILPDIERLLDVPPEVKAAGAGADSDPGRPEPWWEPPDPEKPVGPVMLREPAEPTPPMDAPERVVVPTVWEPDPTAEAITRDDTLMKEAEPPPDDGAIAQRRRRAEKGMACGWVVTMLEPGRWHVLTHPKSNGYIVTRHDGRWMCECPDFSNKGLGVCKHTFGVEIAEGSNPDRLSDATPAETRPDMEDEP